MVVKDKEEASEEIEWNVETEVQLFYAMIGHKPVGVNKHFQMACILEKFRNALNKDISSKVIWDHLDTMYDMQALDDTENLPFPNDDKDFCLPESEFGDLMAAKINSDTSMDQSSLDNEVKKEPKVVIKKEVINKELKEPAVKKEGKEIKDTLKEIKRESKEHTKEPKKISKDKDLRRESKDSKDGKKEIKKEVRETPKEVKVESVESKEVKSHKVHRTSTKEKKESRKDDTDKDDSTATLSTKKERPKDSHESRHEDTPKRIASGSGSGNSSSGAGGGGNSGGGTGGGGGGTGTSSGSSSSSSKRSTRGVLKPDDVSSSKSSSPISTPTPPPYKRRRT